MRSILPFFLLLAAQQQPYIETFEVHLHNLDVVVSDAHGRTISSLTKDDFLVFEDGKAQEVTNFSEYAGSTGRASVPGAASPSEPEKEQPRRFIFFVDEMALHPMSRAKVIKSATSLIETSMHDGDLGQVVRPAGEAMEFTSDRAAVVAALKNAIEATSSRVTTQSFRELLFLQQQLSYASDKAEAYAVRKQYADMARRRVEQRLGRIRALVGSLAGIEGRKVLVLMTASLSAQPGLEAFDLSEIMVHGDSEGVQGLNPAYKDLRPQFEELARTAAANGVTMYPLQPDVPIELAISAAGSSEYRRRTSPRPSLPEYLYPQIVRNTETTLVTLAEKTGGRWFRGDGAIDDAFRQVGTDLTAYYSLAYRARGEAASKHVEVRIRNHPEYRVRTRTDVIERSTADEMADQVVASLFYPRQSNELAIRAQAGTVTHDRNLYTVPLDTLIPMEKLTFLPAPDGKYHASFTIHYAAAGEKSDFTVGQERAQEIELTEAQFRELAGKLFHYSSNLVVAKGNARIAVGVLDRTSRLSGFAALSVDAR